MSEEHKILTEDANACEEIAAVLARAIDVDPEELHVQYMVGTSMSVTVEQAEDGDAALAAAIRRGRFPGLDI